MRESTTTTTAVTNHGGRNKSVGFSIPAGGKEEDLSLSLFHVSFVVISEEGHNQNMFRRHNA